MEKKILVADDEEHIVKMLESRLRANGYGVITAYNGKQALEKAKAGAPDLILLDIMMPDIDGLSVLRKLKYDFETMHIPVIMLTCKADSGSIFKAQDLKAADYIIKPFKPGELLKLIKRYI
jgi:DNA-binding response OmpR family regulator